MLHTLVAARAVEERNVLYIFDVSLWEEHTMTDRIVSVLDAVHINSPEGHHFGRPFVSSYQIAIRLLEADPTLSESLDLDVGGRGTGRHVSLAQYVGQNLSRQIRADPMHRIEGAFMSSELVRQVVYRRPGGEEDVVSSLSGTDFDMALFRLRRPG